MRILIAEDDQVLADGLLRTLRASGAVVDHVASGSEADAALLTNNEFDLLILDLGLPKMHGLEVLKRLRSRGTALPVLILTAADSVEERVKGLDFGADDYMAKPFSPRELLARLRALLRRTRTAVAAEPPAAIPGKHCFGPFALDISAHRLLRDGSEVRITTAEFELLRVFVERPNRVLSRDDIIDLLKGYDRAPFDRSVDIRVTRLRRRIETDPSNPEYIRTVRGEGYLFNPLGAQVRR